MNMARKCVVVALSALFAGASTVSAGAGPLPIVTIQPSDTAANAQVVQYRCAKEDRPCTPENLYRDRLSEGQRYYRDRSEGRRYYRDGRYEGRRHYRQYRHRNGDAWLPLGMFGMGAIVGGAIANDRAYSGGGSHVNWCANRYRSYRAYDNTYQPYGGPRRQCYSPYR